MTATVVVRLKIGVVDLGFYFLRYTRRALDAQHRSRPGNRTGSRLSGLKNSELTQPHGLQSHHK